MDDGRSAAGAGSEHVDINIEWPDEMLTVRTVHFCARHVPRPRSRALSLLAVRLNFGGHLDDCRLV